MARPKKKGLDYFPLDNDIFEDEKLFDLQNEYGPLGEVIYIRLLCLINKNGYYYKFKNIDTLSAMLIKSIGNRWARDKKTVREIILYLAEINLFSSELMQCNVITSRGVQRRYLKAVERRQSDIGEFNLLEKSDLQEGLLSVPQNRINVAETQVNAAETPVDVSSYPPKESKENKSKVNESKGKYRCSQGGLMISPEEKQELISMSDSLSVEKYIKKLLAWQMRTGKLCREPFRTVKGWIEQDMRKKEVREPSYDIDEFEQYAMNFSLSKKNGWDNNDTSSVGTEEKKSD